MTRRNGNHLAPPANTAPGDWFTASEVTEWLGVKRATIYSYVSRGLIRRSVGRGGSVVYFGPDVRRLALKGRKSRLNKEGYEQLIDARLATVGDGVPCIRGESVIQLAERFSFDEFTEWLWSRPESSPEPSWRTGARQPDAAQLSLILDVDKVVPADAPPLNRVLCGLSLLAARTPEWLGARAGSSVFALGHRLLQDISLLAASQVGPARESSASSIAERLVKGLCRARGTEFASAVRLVDNMLIAAADYALAVPAVALRLCSSIGAELPLAMLCAISATRGTQPGTASLAVEDCLRQIKDHQSPAEFLDVVKAMPGFGHPRYQQGDPRARYLLARLADERAGTERISIVHKVLEAAEDNGRPPPNIDFALAAMAYVLKLRRGTGEVMIALGGTPGWMIHLWGSERPGESDPKEVEQVTR